MMISSKVDWDKVTGADGTIDLYKVLESTRPEALADPEFRGLVEDIDAVLKRQLDSGGLTSPDAAIVAAVFTHIIHSVVCSVRALPYLVAAEMIAGQDEGGGEIRGESPVKKGPPKAH